jgi:hypothetical protein
MWKRKLLSKVILTKNLKIRKKRKRWQPKAPTNNLKAKKGSTLIKMKKMLEFPKRLNS